MCWDHLFTMQKMKTSFPCSVCSPVSAVDMGVLNKSATWDHSIPRGNVFLTLIYYLKSCVLGVYLFMPSSCHSSGWFLKVIVSDLPTSTSNWCFNQLTHVCLFFGTLIMNHSIITGK